MVPKYDYLPFEMGQGGMNEVTWWHERRWMLDANGRRFEETSGYPYAEIFSTPFRWDPAGMVLDLGVPLRLPKGLTWSLEAELYVYPLGLNSEGAAIDMHYDTQYRPWEKESKAVGLLFR